MSQKKSLKNKVVLVTAGPTREFIDSVRYISNRSSGKMGYALAKTAGDMGAKVILISGPVSLPVPANTKIIRVETAAEMLKAILKNIKTVDIFIMAAAVSDFTLFKRAPGKIKRGKGPLLLKLKPTPDILKQVAKEKGLKKNLIKAGFAAETSLPRTRSVVRGSSIARAYQKLKDKSLDLIIANDISRKDIGFESDYNEVHIIKRNKTFIKTKRLKKEKIAQEIILYVLDKANPG